MLSHLGVTCVTHAEHLYAISHAARLLKLKPFRPHVMRNIGGPRRLVTPKAFVHRIKPACKVGSDPIRP